MDARLTDEQQMLVKMATLVAADLAPASVDALTLANRHTTDASAWSALVDAGLVGLHVPASSGGGGGRVVDAALVAEQFAGALAPVPYVGAAVWAPTLLAAAGAHGAVEAVVSGSLRLAPVLRPDLRSLAHRREDGVAFDAQGADAGLVLDEDDRLLAVALGRATRSVDLTRSMHVLGADAPPVKMAFPLGNALTTDDLAHVEAVALAVLAADLLGVAQRALDDAVAHVGQRKQFGVPVGSFQAVQHLAAHATMLIEAARSSMWHGAWAADELPAAEGLLAARQAKAFCSTAARRVGETAIQMLGGIGLTWEHLAHVRQRRILTSSPVLGDETAQHAAIAAARIA